jgi:hypothetical protein
MKTPVQAGAVCRDSDGWRPATLVPGKFEILPAAKGKPSKGTEVAHTCDNFGATYMTCGPGCCDYTQQFCLNGNCIDFQNAYASMASGDSFCFKGKSGNSSVCINHP